MRAMLLLASTVAATSLATPSGNRWFLDNCSSTCTLQSGLANGNRVCARPAGAAASTPLRCLPEVRFAASIDNAGGTTIPGQQAISYSAVLSTMRVAFDRWTLTNTTCAPTIAFAFETQNFTTPVATAAVAALDDNNNVIWLSGTNWRYSNATLGLTTNTWYPNGELSDSDMEMNASTVTWGAGNPISSGDYDYESVVTHEAGHYIGIAHTPNSVAVMFANIGTGEIKRNLQGPDMSDVCAIYPPGSGAQGSVCTGSGCTNPLVCEGPTGSSTRICTKDCTNLTDPCPAGFSCQASTNGNACLPQIGAPDMCKFCTAGQDCSTGQCLTDGAGKNWCSMSCNPNVAGQCGAGYMCTTTAAGSYCFPTSACTNQCTMANVATNCAPGYSCVSGTCTPTGNTGDRCEVSDFCKSCSACATDEVNASIAFCRACCNNGAPLCTGCSTTTCSPVGGAMTQCLPINGRAEQLCYPSSGSATCQACSAAMPCAGGAQCLGGFCRATCNPGSPGSCPACQSTANGGICACAATEISDANQPCSATGTMLAICRNGLSCISNFCRRRCTMNDPSSCPVDATCQLVGLEQVCIPGNAGQRCAMCGNGGQCEAGLICYSNRCYPPCTTTLQNQCATCVQVEPDPPAGSGAGVCACPDQIVGPGASCLLPNISSCQPGTRCISGVCQGRCDPANPNSCPAGHLCQPVGPEFYCAVDNSGQGGGGAGGGGGTPNGGGRTGTGGGVAITGGGSAGGNVMVTNMGCNCQGADGGLSLLALLGLALLRRRA